MCLVPSVSVVPVVLFRGALGGIGAPGAHGAHVAHDSGPMVHMVPKEPLVSRSVVPLMSFVSLVSWCHWRPSVLRALGGPTVRGLFQY